MMPGSKGQKALCLHSNEAIRGISWETLPQVENLVYCGFTFIFHHDKMRRGTGGHKINARIYFCVYGSRKT
jgi:hypothetical protein